VTGQPGWQREPRVTLQAARQRAERTGGTHRKPPPADRRRPDLSPEERAEAAKIIGGGGGCHLCGGLHAGDELACPRLASFRLDGDGKITEGAYWAPGEWEDPERVILAEDASEPEP
jgi:hypothetical protein